MSAEINNEELQAWHDKVTDAELSQSFKEDLKSFLERLLKNLSSTKINLNLAGMLPKLSKLGPLLEELCSCSAVILDKELYELVMRCVLQLLVDNPDNVVEQKATSFARTQIRQTVSYYKQEDPCSTLAHHVGCNSDQYNAESCGKLMTELGERLHNLPHHTWNCIDGFMLPGRPLPSEVLTDLSLRCLPLLKVPGSHHVIEALLVCHPCSSVNEPLHPSFFKALIDSQRNAYSETSCDVMLSYHSQVALWDRHLPALEEEVVALVKNLCQPWLSRQQTIKSINRRHLPHACLEHPSIYAAVDNLLQAVLERTEASLGILRMLDCFHQALLHCANSPSLQKKSPGICSLHPLRLRSLLNLLVVSPQGLSVKSCCLHLSHKDNILSEIANCSSHELNQKDLYEMWLVLIKWPTWYYKAIEMMLTADWSRKPPGIKLVCWFNYPLQKENHEKFKELVTSLSVTCRKCVNQSYFQIRDLKDAILANQHPECSQVMNIIQPMCQLLVIYSKEGLRKMQQIMALALQMEKEPNATEQLRFLLDAIELFHQLNGSSQIPNSKQILDHLQSLRKMGIDSLLAAGDIDRAAMRKETDRILLYSSDAESYLKRS